MRKHQKKFGLIWVLLITVSVLIVGVGSWVVYQSNSKDGTTKDNNPIAIMAQTAKGGLCSTGPCSYPIQKLYSNGEFDGYTGLSSSEVSELKRIIDTTDFLKYPPSTKLCPSAVDGADQVLLFPQKYGNREFTPCALDIPADDPAFTFINDLLLRHAIE